MCVKVHKAVIILEVTGGHFIQSIDVSNIGLTKRKGYWALTSSQIFESTRASAFQRCLIYANPTLFRELSMQKHNFRLSGITHLYRMQNTAWFLPQTEWEYHNLEVRGQGTTLKIAMQAKI